MLLQDAPLFLDIAPGPEDGAAWWVSASDGLRLRIAAWGRDRPHGTVLIFPGRTEYVEKYGPAAQDFAARGFATISIDWRGQGLADRMLDDRRIGHVDLFQDYQKDVAMMLRAARALDLPKPYYLVAHSMGGCIGLRSVYEDLPVQSVVFSAPMWGIRIAPALRPAAWALALAMPKIGQGGRLAPTTVPEPYVIKAPFDDNKLTTDRPMHDMMFNQITTHTDLSLGGPSYVWLREALIECANLAAMPAPNLDCATYLGTNERIVHVPRIHERMEHWSNGKLHMVERGEHEVLMETPDIRNPIFDKIATQFRNAA
ncbi:MAG: alpha/beta hydrolase [Paracoccaceae bacterium]